MKILTYEIPEGLFIQYVMSIKNLQVLRNMNPKYYADMDKHRGELHDEILSILKVDRDNYDFKYALAIVVEKYLSQRQVYLEQIL